MLATVLGVRERNRLEAAERSAQIEKALQRRASIAPAIKFPVASGKSCGQWRSSLRFIGDRRRSNKLDRQARCRPSRLAETVGSLGKLKGFFFVFIEK